MAGLGPPAIDESKDTWHGIGILPFRSPIHPVTEVRLYHRTIRLQRLVRIRQHTKNDQVRDPHDKRETFPSDLTCRNAEKALEPPEEMEEALLVRVWNFPYAVMEVLE